MQRQVARAVAADAPRRVKSRIEVLPEIAEHHLDLQAAAAEDDCLHPGPNPGRGDSTRLEHRAATNAQVSIEERRVVKDQAPLAARRATTVDQRDVVFLEEALRQLEWVADRRRCTDESRVRAVEVADPLQPADDVRHLAPEETSIGVQLVDDDELEARKEPPPTRVMGQQPGMEHVWIRHHDVAAFADSGAPARRRVAVIGVDANVDRQARFQRPELCQLVLRQGFGRIYI